MTDTGATDMTADIEVMMTDHMTDTDIEADSMMGEQERILVEERFVTGLQSLSVTSLDAAAPGVAGWSGGGSMTATTPGTRTGTSWITAGAGAGSRTPGWSSGTSGRRTRGCTGVMCWTEEKMNSLRCRFIPSTRSHQMRIAETKIHQE